MESLNWDLSFEKSLYDIRKLESKLKSEMKSMKVFEKSEIFIDIIRRQSIFILFLWFRNIFGKNCGICIQIPQISISAYMYA